MQAARSSSTPTAAPAIVVQSLPATQPKPRAASKSSRQTLRQAPVYLEDEEEVYNEGVEGGAEEAAAARLVDRQQRGKSACALHRPTSDVTKSSMQWSMAQYPSGWPH